jgi:DNA-directed RNA polymerase subunit L
MDSKMASIENIKNDNRGFEFSCELRNVPVSFVNAIRRTVLSSIPTVVIRDIKILENTTQIPHEMLKHRMEMLPVNVSPDDSATIRDSKIELRILQNDADRIVTTDDFVVESGREKILMRDRDMDTPILFVKLRAGEKIHIKASLSTENTNVSQVCNATTGWKIDKDLAEKMKKTYVEDGGDARAFDNFYIQKAFHRDGSGRPNWFDLTVESIGVLKSRDIMKIAMTILRNKLTEYMTEASQNIRREQDDGSYSITLEQGGHTLGALLQEVIYSDKNVKFVSYDVPHPLRNTMVLRFNTSKTPESVLRMAKDTIEEYYSLVEKVL